MYAGTTLRHRSGKIVGVHQKIDRIARNNIAEYLPKSVLFPTTKEILHFEGKNGPDAIRYMSPAIDKPWHFIDPAKPEDRLLLQIIENHVMNLADAIKSGDNIRSAFECAWLAHAVVDGLTPSHHYPLNDKIEELWGKPRHEIEDGKIKKIIHGSNRRDTFIKTWEYWGAGGVMTAHLMFEMGVASAISADKFKSFTITPDDLASLRKNGFETEFMKILTNVDEMKMYDKFGKTGWTRKLANKAKKDLIPEMIKAVVLAWYEALIVAEVV